MLGTRLKLARKKAGLSLRALSERIGGAVSAQAIGKYERDEMTPGSDVLIAIGKALGEPVSFFMNPLGLELAHVEFRKHSGTSVKDRARVESAVLDHVDRYLIVEEILGLDSATWDQPFAAQELQDMSGAERLADDLRSIWNLGEDPIPDMTELLEEHAIKILSIELPKRVSGLTCKVKRTNHDSSVPVIVVNALHNLERRRFTLAHELAHRLIDADSVVDVEKAAMRFAGAFLMPRTHVLREVGNRRNSLGYREVIDLKHLYRVSAAAVLMRLEQLEVITLSAKEHAFRTTFRGCRTTEPEPLRDSEAERTDRFHRLCYRAVSEELISVVKAAELLRRPVKEIETGVRGPQATTGNRQ